MFAGTREIALSELIGALSYALDVAEGEPPGHAVRTCLIGMRLGDELGLDAQARSDLFYALLLKDAGCSANSAQMAALFGADEQEAKRTSKRIDWARRLSAFVWSVRTVAPGGSVRARAERLQAIRDEGEVTRSLMRARCERGAEIARMLGFSEATAEAIRALDEHWDGRGQPRGLRGEEIPLGARILCLAQTVEIFNAAGGVRAACRVAQKRSGDWFDPVLVDALGAFAPTPASGRRWPSRTCPPSSRPTGSSSPTRSDWTDGRCVRPNHRREVAVDPSALRPRPPDRGRHRLTAGLRVDGAAGPGASGAAARHRQARRVQPDPRQPRAAHRRGVRRIKEHPLFTERILERVPGFSELAPLASAHHERLDGSGYPYGLRPAS